jgi:hypothetical protein
MLAPLERALTCGNENQSLAIVADMKTSCWGCPVNGDFDGLYVRPP